MVEPTLVFQIHFFLFSEAHTHSNPRFSLEDIKEKCQIGDLKNTKVHCNFLEKEKYLIRNWEHREASKTGYQQIQPGDGVMDEVRRRIMEKLCSLNDGRVDLILDDAPIDNIDSFRYVFEKGKKYEEELPILKIIYDEYWKYLENLKVFQIDISPDKLDVTKSEKQIKIQGTISKPYQKAKGKIQIRIFLLDFKVDKEMESNVTFVSGTIDGSINFPQGYKAGDHTLVGYYQLEGDTSERLDAYPNSGRIPFRIISG